MTDKNDRQMVVRDDRDTLFISPAATVAQALDRYDAVVELVRSRLWRDGVDSGEIPGASKPTLLKPGAEKLCAFFGLTPLFETTRVIEDWTGKDHGGEPLFAYTVTCSLMRGDRIIAQGAGDAHSWETKHRYRWVKAEDVPPGVTLSTLQRREDVASEPRFAVQRKETGGKYGKPLSYWERFEAAIEDGTAVTETRQSKAGNPVEWVIIADATYRVPNGNPADLTNTLMKMSQKRGLVAAVLLATNASEFFTQDLEDWDGGVIVDAEVTKATQKTPEGHWTQDDAKLSLFQTRALQEVKKHAPEASMVDAKRAVLEALGVPELVRYTGTGANAMRALEAYLKDIFETQTEPEEAEHIETEDEEPF